MRIITECKECRFQRKGKCKHVNMTVSINATWCAHFKQRLIYKLKEWVK